MHVLRNNSHYNHEDLLLVSLDRTAARVSAIPLLIMTIVFEIHAKNAKKVDI